MSSRYIWRPDHIQVDETTSEDSVKDELLKQGPPGPPPHPGLVWHEETHRWRRKDTGEVYDETEGSGEPVETLNAISEEISTEQLKAMTPAFQYAFNQAKTSEHHEDLTFVQSVWGEFRLKETSEKLMLHDTSGTPEVAMLYDWIDGGVYVQSLATHPKNLHWANNPDRIKGAGTKALVALAKLAVKQGAKHMELGSRPSSIPFYKALGFKMVDKGSLIMRLNQKNLKRLAELS